MLKEIEGTKYTRLQHKQLYVEFLNHTYENVIKVASYDTVIGYIDTIRSLFVTWGYRKYSATTTRHITQICKGYGLERLDVENREEALENILIAKCDRINAILGSD